MLDELRMMAIFAKTVEFGSFRGAARALRISPSVVSHHISLLEDRLGATLLYRSTRKISLTEDGARLLKQAQAMVSAAELGLEEMSDRGDVLSGVIRIAMPAVLAQSIVIDRIVEFTNDHPKIRLEFDFSDSLQDIIGGGYDIAIRMGDMRDSALKMRKLNEFQRVVVASANYVSGLPSITQPSDLKGLDWIELSHVPLKPRFQREGHRTVTLKPQSSHVVNDALALGQMARAGAGLAILPDCLVGEDIGQGKLIRLLPEWTLDPIGVYVLWPPNASKSGLAMRLVAHLVEFAPTQI